MKNLKVIYSLLCVSILVNVILACILLFGNSKDEQIDNSEPKEVSKEQLEQKAKAVVKEYVCSNLFHPDSYDPVETRVDSAFYSCMTDRDCLVAAYELIDLRSKYNSAKASYDEAVNNIRTFGGTGVFRHFSVERDDAKKTMDETKPKIEERERIIKNRDDSHDGEFVGWFIYNRYRAKSNNGNVSFGEALIVADKDMNSWVLQYVVDKKETGNIDEIKKVMDELLKPGSSE